jgi:hypothetical protein
MHHQEAVREERIFERLDPPCHLPGRAGVRHHLPGLPGRDHRGGDVADAREDEDGACRIETGDANGGAARMPEAGVQSPDDVLGVLRLVSANDANRLVGGLRQRGARIRVWAH